MGKRKDDTRKVAIQSGFDDLFQLGKDVLVDLCEVLGGGSLIGVLSRGGVIHVKGHGGGRRKVVGHIVKVHIVNGIVFRLITGHGVGVG